MSRVSKLEDLLGSSSSFTSMTDKERAYFAEIIREEIRRRTESNTWEQIRPVVPIEEWINSTYYVGPDAQSIYPYWKDFIVDVFREDRGQSNKINNVILSGSIGTGKSCILHNSRVPTSIGLYKIDKLHELFHKKGVRFKVLSESGIRDCTDVYDNGIADTKIVKFKSGRSVEGTYNHKFRVIRDGKIEWVRFDEMVVGDKTLMTAKESPFGNLYLDPDEAYTLGYMTGDGWVTKAKRKNGYVYDSICVMFQEEQVDVAKRIRKAFNNWFGDKFRVLKTTKLQNGNTMTDLQFRSKELATKLVESGFGCGSENKGVPEFIFRCDRETIANYISGVFDSDGTVEKNGYTYVGMKSGSCISDIGHLLSMYGINYRLHDSDAYLNGKNTGRFYELDIIGTDSYLKFFDTFKLCVDYKFSRLKVKIDKCSNGNNRNNRVLIPDGVKELKRIDEENSLGSRRVVQNFIQFRFQDNYTLNQLRKLDKVDDTCHEWVSQSEYLRYLCDNEVFFDEVCEISDSRGHTYDLSVDEDHSYCFDGFISHNTCSEILMLRKLYELSCFKNINSMFHLMSKTSIMFIYFSVNQKQAERTGFGEFRSFVDNSPYFRENFRRRERLNSILMFPEGLTFAYGSNASDSIGMSVICSMLDEANFLGGTGNGGGSTERAMDLYANIVNRANSRFIMDGGINHSLNILVSSATHEGSATAKQIELSRDDPHTLVAAPSQWEVKPEKFSKKYFYVFKGSSYLEPIIVESVDDVNNFRLSEGLKKERFMDGVQDFDKIDGEIKKLPPHLQDKFLKVPVDLRKGFETNIIRSLQDLGGISTGTTGKLFNSPAVFNDCIDKSLRHPFTSQEIIISTGDNIEIKDYLRDDFRLQNPERPRYIHIDQSYRTDSTGISCVYISDVEVDDDGVKKPIFTTDFMLRINPPKPPKKIAIYKIRNFVIYLNRVVGMRIGKVTYDIFNSEESRQILEEMGFNVGYRSVDRNDKAYLDLVEIMYEGRLRVYDYPILRHELFNLIHYRDKRKVDHPKVVMGSSYAGKGSQEGSKDLSDSLCGAVANCLEFSISEGADELRTLDDFMKINEYNGFFEPDASSVEEIIDRQIDEMIESIEYGGSIYGLGGITQF